MYTKVHDFSIEIIRSFVDDFIDYRGLTQVYSRARLLLCVVSERTRGSGISPSPPVF